MQHVPELMEQGLDIVVAEQRGRVARAAGHVHHDRRDAAHPRAVLGQAGEPDRPGHGVPELARPGVEVGIAPAEMLAARPVADVEQSHIRVPGPRLGRLDEREVEDLGRQREQPVERGVEREVGRDLVGVHAELVGEDPLVVIGDVP